MRQFLFGQLLRLSNKYNRTNGPMLERRRNRGKDMKSTLPICETKFEDDVTLNICHLSRNLMHDYQIPYLEEDGPALPSIRPKGGEGRPVPRNLD